MNDRQVFGRLGEDFAQQVLQLDGYEIVKRNYRCKEGEIDIIAEKDNELFFIEVKSRRNQNFGTPGEAVDGKKQQRLRRTAGCYLAETQNYRRFYSFQVIEIVVSQIMRAF